VGRAQHRRFLVSPGALRDAEVTFNPAQARQLSAVLRLRAGDPVAVFDGAGRQWTARLTLVTPRRATARLLDEEAPTPPSGFG
jgi:16S rRNA U1498 N3-methylase RsmE